MCVLYLFFRQIESSLFCRVKEIHAFCKDFKSTEVDRKFSKGEQIEICSNQTGTDWSKCLESSNLSIIFSKFALPAGTKINQIFI